MKSKKAFEAWQIERGMFTLTWLSNWVNLVIDAVDMGIFMKLWMQPFNDCSHIRGASNKWLSSFLLSSDKFAWLTLHFFLYFCTHTLLRILIRWCFYDRLHVLVIVDNNLYISYRSSVVNELELQKLTQVFADLGYYILFHYLE